MRFSFCCYGLFYQDKEMIEGIGKRRGTFIEIQTGPPLSSQPRPSESIQMDTIATKQMHTKPSTQNPSTSKSSQISESLYTTISTIPVTQFTATTSKQPFVTMIPSLSATSNFNYIAKNGQKTVMAFEQIRPDFGCGTYKGSKFTIVKGELQSPEGVYSEQDQRRILKNYSQALMAIQQGILGVEASLLKSLQQELPPVNPHHLQELTIPAGSKISVDFTAEGGDKTQMTFRQVKPGLFRATLNDQVFTIANGQVLTLDGADHGLNKELILSSFYRAMLGLRQTQLGVQESEWAKEARLSQGQLNPMELLKSACPEKRSNFEAETEKMHNEFRRLHGAPPLVHSEFLCELARHWAEHLALKNASYQKQNNEFGENLYYSHGEPLDAKKVVTSWYDEVNLYDFNNSELSKETGHFTQLVWKSTKEIGTGIAQLGDKIWVCCYYYPRGNIESRLDEEVLPPVEEKEEEVAT